MDWSCGKATVHMRTSLTHLDTFWNISTHLDATRLLPFCFGPALNIVTGRLTYLHFLLGYIGVIDNYVMCVWLCVCVLRVVCRYVIICIQLVAWLQVSGLTKSLLLNCGEPPLCKASARLTSKVRLSGGLSSGPSGEHCSDGQLLVLFSFFWKEPHLQKHGPMLQDVETGWSPRSEQKSAPLILIYFDRRIMKDWWVHRLVQVRLIFVLASPCAERPGAWFSSISLPVSGTPLHAPCYTLPRRKLANV